MATIKGLDVLIKVEDTVVGGQRNGTLEMSAETIDTTVKSSGGWTTKIPGIKSWTSSCDGVYFTDDAGFAAVQSAFLEGTELTLSFSNDSGVSYSGAAVITSMSLEAGQEDVVAYSMAFDGSGALTTQKA